RVLAAPDDDPYGLILIDHKLPGMDAAEVARAIKAAPRYAGVPLVLLTSLGAPAVGGGAPGLFSAMLVKPVRRARLDSVLGRLVVASDGAGARGADSPCESEPALLALNVLLVEDNAVNRLVAAAMLDRLGCRVEAVENGREAVTAAACARFDV